MGLFIIKKLLQQNEYFFVSKREYKLFI